MKRKRRRGSVLFFLSFCFFLAIMDYPFVARIFNSRHQGSVVMDYRQDMARAEAEEKETEWKRAVSYNEELAAGMGESFGEYGMENPAYGGTLNMKGDGIMGMIEIPVIHVNLPIYHGTEEDTLQKGVGHLEGSSLPVGGADTHVCISAHRGLVGKKMFTDLDQLKEGDIFLLHVLEQELCYRVRRSYVVRPDETESLLIQPGEDLVTLITCTPYGINTHRLMVEGERIPYTEKVEEEIAEKTQERSIRDWWWLGLSAVLLLFMAVLLLRYNLQGREEEDAEL